MNNIVQIAGKPMPVREYQGQRVVTINDVAEVHRVPSDSIRRNFNRNRNRFEKEIDYYSLRGKFRGTNCPMPPHTSCINVFTETGYLMLVKSMTDDLAWKVQRQLVNLYFRVTRLRSDPDVSGELRRGKRESVSVGLIAGIAPLMKDEYRKILYYRVVKGLTQNETGLLLGHSARYVQYKEQDITRAGVHIPSQSGKRQSLMIGPQDPQLGISN